MEDFVDTIKNNTEKDIVQVEKRSAKLKQLLCKILSSDSKIKITEESNDNGDVRFEVYTKSLGLDLDMIMRNQREINTEFMANFLGEILVREHIDKFINVLINMKSEYLNRVCKHQFEKFGMTIYKDRILFMFHSSLIQKILTEDIRNNLQ